MRSGQGFFLIVSLSLLLVGSGAVLPGWSLQAQGQPATGAALYDRHCAGCHGPDGKGDGPAADFLSPRPRDFTPGTFKVRSTASGDLPSDEDLFWTITRGMPGTAMPGWENLSEAERRELVRYVKTFSERFAQEPSPGRVPVGSPVPPNREGLARGRQIYRQMKCWECHGEEGRGDGPSAPTLKDDWGFPIRVGNLTKGWAFRGGASVEDIYRTFTTGLDGTPMPSFADSLKEAERWQLAHYIHSLSTPRPPGGRRSIRARFLGGPLPHDPRDSRWAAAEPVEILLAGQIIQRPRLHTPATTSLTVRALYNQSSIAFLLQWDDGTMSLRKVGDGVFNDAVAIQFPAAGPAGPVRPYFLLGDSERPVILWRWEAGSAFVQEFTARGLGTQSPRPSRERAVKGNGVSRNGQWSVVMERNLTAAGKAPDIQFRRENSVPIAFYVWDGSAGELWAKGGLTTWHWLLLDASSPVEAPRETHPVLPAEYLALENPLPATPDVIREGKALYFKHCVFCHGDKLDGRGYFAEALDPRPADFTSSESIAQLHESYLFWRIREGGRGLPAESSPWDSAMPRWKDDLSDQEIWKVIRFLYDAIGVTPRSWIE